MPNSPEDIKKACTHFRNAAFTNDVERAKLILRKYIEVDINAVNPDNGATALHKAARAGNEAFVDFLLSFPQINIHALENSGENALFAAVCGQDDDKKTVKGGNIRIVEKLLQRGADPGVIRNDGCTALKIATYCNRFDIVQLLFKYAKDKIDVDVAPRGDNITPLMSAARLGNLEMVKFLIAQGADIFKQCTFSKGNQGTAYDWAVLYDQTEIAEYLKGLMAQHRAALAQKEQLNLQQQLDVKLLAEQQIKGLLEQFAKANEDRLRNLEKAQCQSLQDKADLEKKLIDTEAEIQILRADKQRKQAVLMQQAHINRNVPLKAFYDRFQSKLTGLFLAYIILDTGLIDKADDKFGKGANTAVKCIKLLGETIPLPGASLIAAAINLGIKGAQAYHDSKEINLIAYMAKLVTTPKDLSKKVELLARQLVLCYEEQISQLTVNGAETLAECGVRRITEYLRAGQLTEQEPLVEQCVKAIATFDAKQGTFPFTNRTIETQQKRAHAWSDRGIFQRSAICTPEGETYSGPCCKPDIYGFRLAEAKETQRLGYKPLVTRQPVTARVGLLSAGHRQPGQSLLPSGKPQTAPEQHPTRSFLDRTQQTTVWMASAGRQNWQQGIPAAAQSNFITQGQQAVETLSKTTGEHIASFVTSSFSNLLKA